jgi:AcrR family transcriptional regulator
MVLKPEARSRRHTRPERPLDPVRRPQILATTVELMRERGLWRLRVADVAERAGTSPTSVIYYFGTKDQLFEQAIADADAAFYAKLWPELERYSSGHERLACLIVHSSVSEWILWIDLWVYARRHPRLRDAVTGFHARWCQTIAEAIRHGQRRGEFAPVDAERVAERLAALTDGLAVHMVLEEPGCTRESYIESSLAAAAAELGCRLEDLLAAARRLEESAPAG